MFIINFSKTAALDHNNQGIEFKISDTEPQPNVGPGGMAPTGIPSYQPIVSDKPTMRRNKKMSTIEAAQFILKQAGFDIAPGVSEQLKWTTDNGSDWHESVGDTRERNERLKRIKKTRKNYV